MTKRSMHDPADGQDGGTEKRARINIADLLGDQTGQNPETEIKHENDSTRANEQQVSQKHDASSIEARLLGALAPKQEPTHAYVLICNKTFYRQDPEKHVLGVYKPLGKANEAVMRAFLRDYEAESAYDEPHKQYWDGELRCWYKPAECDETELKLEKLVLNEDKVPHYLEDELAKVPSGEVLEKFENAFVRKNIKRSPTLEEKQSRDRIWEIAMAKMAAEGYNML